MLVIFVWWSAAVVVAAVAPAQAANEATSWTEVDQPYCAVRYRRLCQGKGRHVACQFPFPEPGESCRNYTMIKFTKELRHFITHYINRRRHRIASGNEKVRGGVRLPQPEVMLQVEWDKELSVLAQRLADQCNFVHDDCRATVRYPYSGQTVGEVKWRRTSDSDVQNVAGSIRRVLDAWWGEKRRVTVRQMTQPFRLTNKGNVWGHFSQLSVWTLRAVGCGAVRHGNHYPRVLLVCDFSHTNMLGQRTIVPGPLAPCPIHMMRKPRSPYPLLCTRVRLLPQRIESPYIESPTKISEPMNYELNYDVTEEKADDDYENSFVNVNPNTTFTSKATISQDYTTYTMAITRKRLKLPSWIIKDIDEDAKAIKNNQHKEPYNNIKRIQKGKSHETDNDDENENVVNTERDGESKSQRVYEIKRISDRKKTQKGKTHEKTNDDENENFVNNERDGESKSQRVNEIKRISDQRKTQEKVFQMEAGRTPETEKEFYLEAITKSQRKTSREPVETARTRYLLGIGGEQNRPNKKHEFEQIMFKAATKYRRTKPQISEKGDQDEERESEEVNTPISIYDMTESHRNIFRAKEWPVEETQNKLLRFRSTVLQVPQTQYYEPVRHRWRPTKDRPQRPGALALMTSPQIRMLTAARAPFKHNLVTQPSLKIDTDDVEQFFKDTGFKATWRQQKKIQS